jgi:hypothetical protein
MTGDEQMGKGRKFTVEKYAVEVWRDDATGKVILEDWFDSEGRRHRIGGPAHVTMDVETGVVLHEWWYEHGNQHREDEPAIINRDRKTGRVTSTVWYLDGVKIAKPKRGAPRPTTKRPRPHP